ncbi:MAG: hypothetical protein ABIH99_04065 [Candidatus Micrarchaeota archaeon]
MEMQTKNRVAFFSAVPIFLITDFLLFFVIFLALLLFFAQFFMPLPVIDYSFIILVSAVCAVILVAAKFKHYTVTREGIDIRFLGVFNRFVCWKEVSEITPLTYFQTGKFRIYSWAVRLTLQDKGTVLLKLPNFSTFEDLKKIVPENVKVNKESNEWLGFLEFLYF